MKRGGGAGGHRWDLWVCEHLRGEAQVDGEELGAVGLHVCGGIRVRAVTERALDAAVAGGWALGNRGGGGA